MQIPGLKDLSAQTLSLDPVVTPGKSPSGKGFNSVMQEVNSRSSGDLHEAINAMEKQILSGKQISPSDLISFQMITSRFNMKVELISKVAESVSGTIKKFQQG